MKRLALFLVILTISIFLLVSCKCKHENVSTASCTESAVCKDCGEIIEMASGHIEIIDDAKAPTCTESGLTEGKHCSVCDTVTVKQETIDALGHTEVVDSGKAPTCIESGLTDGKHCSVCNTVTVKQETISALGHTEVVDKGTPATCTKNGTTDGSSCSRCNIVIKKKQTIAALGHTEGKWIIDVAPTVTENGSKHQICSVCSVTLKTEVAYATGSPGLAFTVNSDGSCSVTGIGSCEESTVYIPEYHDGYKVTSIGASSFKGCTFITKIVIPSSITSIGANAFDGCTSLSNVNIPSGITEISDYVFSNCTELGGISIPSGVKSIGVGAFKNCSKIMVVSLPSTIVSIGSDAFSGCSKLINVSLLSGITYIGSGAFSNCSSLFNIVLPETLKKFDASVFNDCSKLSRVTASEGTEISGNHTFTVYIKSSSSSSIAAIPSDPLVEYIEMYYDDRTSVSELIGRNATSISIKNQITVSKEAGTSNGDSCVIVYDKENHRIIASGIGTAVLIANGKEYNIKVKPAPITLTIITGHSIGYGSQGNTEDSVLCEGGQAYNTSITLKSDYWRSSIKGSALGYTSSSRVVNIDGITSDATGTKGAKGVNSALAYEWNRLTGEKMWVVNCAVGGSCVNQWQVDSPENWLNYTIEAMNMASTVLKNEVSAGHYEYRTTVVLNFSTANFSHQNVVYNDDLLNQWHDGMWNGMVNGANIDIDGDGKIDAPTSIGYVPEWGLSTTNFNTDAPLIYYRAFSNNFSHVFIASDLRFLWRTDEGVRQYFPDINYKTQSGNPITKPTTVKQMLASDESHLTQVSYNAVGMKIANSIYNHIFGDTSTNNVSVYCVTNGGKLVENTMEMTEGNRYQFVAMSNPISQNEFEIVVSDNLKLDDLFYVTATAKGQGSITIKYNGKVIRTITITVK